MIRRGDIFRLPKTGAVVCLLDTPTSKEPGVNCMVVGGTSQTYPKGGYDIYVFVGDLQTAERVEPGEKQYIVPEQGHPVTDVHKLLTAYQKYHDKKVTWEEYQRDVGQVAKHYE